jgi:ABC-type sugar transport system permease subunit
MWSIFIDSCRIISKAIRNPFQGFSLIRYSNYKQQLSSSEAYISFSSQKDDGYEKKYVELLENQLKKLQNEIDKSKEITITPTLNTIILFFLSVSLLSILGLFIAAILFNSPLNEAQKAFVSTCPELLKVALPALAGLLTGKAVK